MNGTNPHFGIAMRSHEDDWYPASLSLKLRLKFKTGHAGHTNVGDEARSLVPSSAIQELFCGAETQCGEAIRFDEILQRTLNGLVVVNDCYES
jgi:hypothetical protein